MCIWAFSSVCVLIPKQQTRLLFMCSRTSHIIITNCQSYDGQFKKMIKTDTAQPELIFISCILLPCQNLTPTLPIMQLDCQQFSQRSQMIHPDLHHKRVCGAVWCGGLVRKILTYCRWFWGFDQWPMLLFFLARTVSCYHTCWCGAWAAECRFWSCSEPPCVSFALCCRRW